jgi:hypothetical protein
MLKSEGHYGTLIMSYPLSFIISKLYDLFPWIQWYSLLFAGVMLLHIYLASRYIAAQTSRILKVMLFILFGLWMTFLWFNLSITTLTVVTVINAVGLLRHHFTLSLAMLAFAFLLRSNIMLIMLPYYGVAYVILREHYRLKRKEWMAVTALVALIGTSFYIQSRDKPYTDWFAFNKVRSALADMGVMKGPHEQFNEDEWLLIQLSWWQEDRILPTKKMLAATPSFSDILRHNLHKISIHNLTILLTQHKFHYWLWLLLGATLMYIVISRQKLRSLALLLFAFGVILLLFTRDVERVTVPLFVMWSWILFSTFRHYLPLRILLLLAFGTIFYSYVSPQLGYRYINEIGELKREAHELIRKNGKACDVSINIPAAFSFDVNTILTYNFLFREERWIPVNANEILPGGWLARHPFFYETHRMSDAYTKRTFEDYHAFMIDESTAYFGGKVLTRNIFSKKLYALYDKYYLRDKPECHHTSKIIAASKHFAISQIYIACDEKKEKKE